MDQYIGKLLDNRYEILDLIGVGGMAMVYKAYCHRLHRFVAVKILRSDFASDSDFRRRFHDEAQAVAMLSHANIVSVYDISKNDDIDYIVMELIDGITLKQYMKKKGSPLGWREALHYITQIMRALSHAHSRGIIHRDIKPQNIMVLRDGSVRVADFGIARVMSSAQNTLTQEALGSVHYISPEQARGSNIDERADIYSAGVVLYEMLTGRLPFEGDSPVSVAIQHISSIPLSPRDLNPEIPEALEIITLKAMSSKIERRYRNAEEMIKDLEEFRKNPNVNFDYEHHQDLIMQAAEEPTQKIDTGSINKKPVPRPTSHVQKKPEEDYDYEIYDDYRNVTGKNAIVKKKPRSGMIPIIAVVSVFLVGVAIFLWVFFIGDLFKPSEFVTVPNFMGKTVEELNNNSEYNNLYLFVESGTKPSDDYEVGQVMEQDPKPDIREPRGEDKIVVMLTVSSGPDFVIMENLKNMPLTNALAEIQTMGLVAASSEYEKSDDIIEGNVIRHTPIEGDRVARGGEVKLIVSSGPEIQTLVMPSLIGMKEETAKKTLEDLNLVCKITYSEDEAPVGEVIYQSIQATQQVEEKTTITIRVSTGPAVPDPEPDPGQSQVPDLGSVKNITINLPTDKETVMVKVTVDNVVKFEAPVNTTNNPVITREVDGVGKQMVRVYLDGILGYEYELDFSS